MTDTLLTRREIAERLRTGVGQISRLIKAGDLTPVRIGRRVYFDWEGEVRAGRQRGLDHRALRDVEFRRKDQHARRQRSKKLAGRR